jgi:hypothetical protein
MIVEFTVTNFRSIRDETTFSLYAENPGSHLTNNIAYPANDKIGVLKSIGIYGANASGKSNLLLAFEALQYLIRTSGDLKDGEPIDCYEPYRLSEETRNAPVRFEVEFVTPAGVRYLYKAAFNKHRIMREQLIGYASKQPAVLFTREETDTWETVKFGTTFKGGKKRFAFFQNNAYLSKAGNSADAPESIRDVFNYLQNHLIRLAHDEHISANMLTKNEDYLKLTEALLSFADIGIQAVTVQEQDTDMDTVKFPPGFPDEMKAAIRRQMKWKYLFSHQTDVGQAEQFELKDESAGTKRLFDLAPLLAAVLIAGGVLAFDELENNMHPLLAELIIKLFNDPQVNQKGGQLIFSTHNVHIMSSDLFRRDQIWFAEKENGVSRYFSLADFDKNIVKSSSPFSRWYLEGRFNAIPKIDYQKIADKFTAFRTSDAEAE